MESELEHILRPLTQRQQRLVISWHKKAQMFGDLVDDIVASQRLEKNGTFYTCTRKAILNGKSIEYNYRIFNVNNFELITNEYKRTRIDPHEYLKTWLGI